MLTAAGIPLEEVARRFGDDDEVMVLSEDITIDHTNHEMIVRKHLEEEVETKHEGAEKPISLTVNRPASHVETIGV